MGKFEIRITGTGIHHNGIAEDAEQRAADFVEELRQAGHVVETATVTVGDSVDDVTSRDGLLAITRRADGRPVGATAN